MLTMDEYMHVKCFLIFSFRQIISEYMMKAIFRHTQKEADCYFYYFAFPFLTNDVNVQHTDLEFLPLLAGNAF